MTVFEITSEIFLRLILIAFGFVLLIATQISTVAQSTDEDLSKCPECLEVGPSPMKLEIYGDRQIAPSQVYPVKLTKGSLLTVTVSATAGFAGQYDVSLYAAPDINFDLNRATCLVRALGKVPSKKSTQPGPISGCDSELVAPDSGPKAKFEGSSADSSKVTSSMAQIQYVSPKTAIYFIVVEFYGAGVKVSFSAKVEAAKDLVWKIRARLEVPNSEDSCSNF